MSSVSNRRYYSTGSTSDSKANVISKLESLYERSSKFPNGTIDRPLHNLISNAEILSIAYNKLKSNPGQMTPGVSPETLDGMSSEVLQGIAQSLKDESFRFSPGRRVHIPKLSGGTRPLTIAPPRDKIVQEAIRMILEAIFEPTFFDSSHGFRPSRSCHTALSVIKHHFQPATWIIEGDISQCFPSINHLKLMKIIEEKITDRKFTNLIWKALNAGYFEFDTYQSNIVGTPQGSIISPILANIFMTQLDKFVAQIKLEFDKGTKSKVSSIANNYHSKISRAKKKGDFDLVIKLSKEARRYPAVDLRDPGFKRLSYVRYADD